MEECCINVYHASLSHLNKLYTRDSLGGWSAKVHKGLRIKKKKKLLVYFTLILQVNVTGYWIGLKEEVLKQQ